MNIEFWLKETIFGIILLGAVGSLLALFLIWIGKRYLPAFLGKLFRGAIIGVAKVLSAPVAKKQTALYLNKTGANKYLVFTRSKS